MSKNGASASWEDTPAGRQVQARLSEERTLLAIDRLLARLDTVEEAVKGLEQTMQQGPGMVAMVADMADEAYRSADANGVSIDDRLKNALTLAEQLTHPDMVQKLNDLVSLTNQLPGIVAMAVDTVDEGMRTARDNGLEPETLVDWAGQFGRAMREAKNEPVSKVGLLGMIRALNDPDRQKALGFSLNFLKHLGKQMK